MLSLIPAVLILILHGPAGVERIAVDGRLGEALRVLATRQSGFEGSANEVLSDKERDEFGALLSLGQDSPEFSRFVAQVLQMVAGLGPASPDSSIPTSDLPRKDVRTARSVLPTRDGYLTCRRTRDGPFGA